MLFIWQGQDHNVRINLNAGNGESRSTQLLRGSMGDAQLVPKAQKGMLSRWYLAASRTKETTRAPSKIILSSLALHIKPKLRTEGAHLQPGYHLFSLRMAQKPYSECR